MDTASAISSALPYVNNDWTLENQQAALGAVAVKQAQGAQNAFAGIDFSDPTSISNGITNLIKSNNPEKASALAGFAFQQQARQSPMVQGMMSGSDPNAGAAPSAPVAAAPVAAAPVAAAPAPGNAPNDDYANAGDINAQAIAAHSSDTLNQVSTAISNIKGLPVEQRPAAIASLKDQLTQRGVPTEAIDQEANYILGAPDKATQDQRLDEVASHIQAHADLHGAVAQGQQPTPEQQAAVAASVHSPSVGDGQPWYVNRVNTPGYAGMAYAAPVLKAAGLDVSPYLQTTRELAAPYISKNAELGAAGPIAAAQEAAKFPYSAAMEQVKTHFEATNTPITLYPPGSTQSQTVTKAQWEANPNVYAGWSTEAAVGPKAAATAGGTKSAEAPYTIQTVKGPNGEDIPISIRVDKDGNTVATQVTQGSGGKPIVGASPADVEDQKNLVENIAKIPATQLTIEQAANNGKRILAFANQIPTGKYTQNLSEAAQLFPGLKNATAYANNAELLKQDLNTSFKSQLQGMAVPRIGSEANAILGAIPKNTSPEDMTKIYGALLTATSDKSKAFNDHITQFKNDPANTPTMTNAQNAWNNSPNNKSLYADPVWNGVKVGGQPAVTPVTVNGHSGLVVFKGLLGKNAIVERLN